VVREEKENAVAAKRRDDWRDWLQENHQKASSVWLIIYHKTSDQPSVYYEEAVEEALCFGWIDSKPNKRDAESYYLFFAKRKPKSNWSKPNRERVERMIAQGRMTAEGQVMIDLAKQTGTWTALQQVENLEIPQDLEELFQTNLHAKENFEAFPPSAKRGILEWILNAKRPETRVKRIKETVDLAEQNIRANQYRK
jgi:uncharacterized protein YdeI (YjbR/CyaY-like superfamily)